MILYIILLFKIRYIYIAHLLTKYKWHKTKLTNCENVFEYNII